MVGKALTFVLCCALDSPAWPMREATTLWLSRNPTVVVQGYTLEATQRIGQALVLRDRKTNEDAYRRFGEADKMAKAMIPAGWEKLPWIDYAVVGNQSAHACLAAAWDQYDSGPPWDPWREATRLWARQALLRGMSRQWVSDAIYAMAVAEYYWIKDHRNNRDDAWLLPVPLYPQKRTFP